SEVKKDSPAEKAGLMPYDKIIKVDGKDLTEWADLQEAIAKKPNKRVSITFSRNGIEKEASVVLEEKEERDVMDNRIKVGALGVVAANNYTDVHFKTVSFSPFEAVGMALEKTVNLTVLMFRGIYKMITGKVSAKAISGPIAIAKMAGDQAKRGISQFASFVAFISINLGIINFIPLGTITDGGLIMLFTAEAIIRKPVNEKFKNATQYIGLALIFLIMGFALYNDFDRYLLDIIHFFKEIAGG
ncbi:MAG: RIP metalloprotease RseP, partial [Candidatus Schekmanbacteria bacterium]